jgi:hypothetical protein
MTAKKKKPVEEQRGCGNCLHWKEETGDADEIRWGHCRRYPPTGVVTRDPVTEEEQPEAVWPPTDPADYCGEYKPKQ